MPTPEELKLMEKGADAAIQVARDYADVLMKPSLAEVGGILSDTVGYWRLKNQVNVLLKSKKLLEDNGIDPRAMLPDIFVPLIDLAGNSSDDIVSDMFASLLSDHANSAREDATHPGYAKLLGQMSSTDARLLILLSLHRKFSYARYPTYRPLYQKYRLIRYLQFDCTPDAVKGLTQEDILLSFSNMERLGIVKAIEYETIDERIEIGSPYEVENIDKLEQADGREFLILEYGERFLLSCTRTIESKDFDVVYVDNERKRYLERQKTKNMSK